MRQAIIVQNPKWEPFTKVGDAFKALPNGTSAVLVVRGRSKEKSPKGQRVIFKAKPDSPEALAADLRKSGADDKEIEKAVKAFKPIKAVAAMLLAFAMLAFTANAQQEISGTLYTTVLNGTNANDGAVMQWRPNDIFTIQGVVTMGGDDTNNVLVTIDESLGANYWTEATQTFELSCANSTNAPTVTLLRLTNTLGTLFFKISQIERADTNTATINSLLIYKDDE